MKRKIHSQTYILIIMFIFIGFCSVLFTSISNENDLVKKISQGYYSDQAIFFKVKDLNMDDLDLITECLEKDDILYKVLDDNIKGVYFKGNKNPFPIIEGRTFEASDFSNKEKVALVGKNVKGQMNEVEYMDYLGETFRIIGILGIHSSSALDTMSYINLDSISFFDTEGIWSLDGNGNIDTTFEKIQDILQREGYEVTEIDQSLPGTQRIYQNDGIYEFIYIALWICLLFSTLAITYYWIQRKDNYIAIKKLCGFSNKEIFLDLLKSYVGFALFGYIFGIVITISSALFGLFQIQLYNIVQVKYLLIPLVGIITCFIPLALMMRSWTSERLRGE